MIGLPLESAIPKEKRKLSGLSKIFSGKITK